MNVVRFTASICAIAGRTFYVSHVLATRGRFATVEGCDECFEAYCSECGDFKLGTMGLVAPTNVNHGGKGISRQVASAVAVAVSGKVPTFATDAALVYAISALALNVLNAALTVSTAKCAIEMACGANSARKQGRSWCALNAVKDTIQVMTVRKLSMTNDSRTDIFHL